MVGPKCVRGQYGQVPAGRDGQPLQQPQNLVVETGAVVETAGGDVGADNLLEPGEILDRRQRHLADFMGVDRHQVAAEVPRREDMRPPGNFAETIGEHRVDLQDKAGQFDLAAGFLVRFPQGAVDQRFPRPDGPGGGTIQPRRIMMLGDHHQVVILENEHGDVMGAAEMLRAADELELADIDWGYHPDHRRVAVPVGRFLNMAITHIHGLWSVMIIRTGG